MNMILNGVFNPANLPPIEITSMYPKILKRINRTDKWKNNPLKLSDIYDRQDLFKIRNKWNRVPLGLNDAQLEEYFITGEDPRLKDEEEIKIEPTSMVLPQETRTQVSGIKTIPNIQTPLPPTPEVSPQLAQASTQNVLPTGLTHTETALLSNEEKAMRLRQRGMA